MSKPKILYQEPSQPSRAAQQARDTRKPKKYPCPLCDRWFLREQDLKWRKHIHTGLWPHKCEICNKAFIGKDHLNNHKNTHLRNHLQEPSLQSQAPQQARRPKKYPCPLCNWRFIQEQDLKRHSSYSSWVSPSLRLLRNFKCTWAFTYTDRSTSGICSTKYNRF